MMKMMMKVVRDVKPGRNSCCNRRIQALAIFPHWLLGTACLEILKCQLMMIFIMIIIIIVIIIIHMMMMIIIIFHHQQLRRAYNGHHGLNHNHACDHNHYQ